MSIEGDDNNFLYGLANSYITFLSTSNFLMTETGYHTDNYTSGVSEEAQVQQKTTTTTSQKQTTNIASHLMVLPYIIYTIFS